MVAVAFKSSCKGTVIISTGATILSADTSWFSHHSRQAGSEVGIKDTGTQCLFFKNLSKITFYPDSGRITLET